MRRVRISYNMPPVFMVGLGDIESQTFKKLPLGSKIITLEKHSKDYAKRFHHKNIMITGLDIKTESELLDSLMIKCSSLGMGWVWIVREGINLFINSKKKSCSFEEISKYVKTRVKRSSLYYMAHIGEGALINEYKGKKAINLPVTLCSLVNTQKIINSSISFNMSREKLIRNGFNSITFTNYGYFKG